MNVVEVLQRLADEEHFTQEEEENTPLKVKQDAALFLIAAEGDIDLAITFAEKQEAELDSVPWTHGGRGAEE